MKFYRNVTIAIR